jgi:hypothetical protein
VGHTINADYYQAFLEHHLCPAVKQKHLHFISGAPPVALHDNACYHVERSFGTLAVGNSETSPLLPGHESMWLSSFPKDEETSKSQAVSHYGRDNVYEIVVSCDN